MDTLLLLAQQQQPTPQETAAIIAAMLVVVGIILAISFGIALVVCFLLYTCQNAVPEQYRTLAPGMIFLLLIPLFNLIWNFFVFQRMPESFKNAFDAQGRTDVGDCGKGIGLWLAICYACSIIPCVNYIAGPAALVLLILFIVKMFSLKGLLESGPAAPPVV